MIRTTPTPSSPSFLAEALHERVVMIQLVAEDLHMAALANDHLGALRHARDLLQISVDAGELSGMLAEKLTGQKEIAHEYT